MANVTVTATNPAITVTKSNSVVNVASTTSSITVSSVAALANVDQVRAQFSSVDNGGDGSFSYSANTGIMTYTGPSATEVRAHLSNTSPIQYNSSTGVIGIDSAALFTGKTTDDLTEGTTNKYFTTTGATVNTDALPEGSTNLYYTNARANAAFVDSLDNITTALSSNANITTTANVAGANFIGNVVGNVTGSPSSLAGLDTDDLSEGSTNLYYTSARADADIADYKGAIINMTGNLTTTANIQASSAEFTGTQVYLSGGDLTTSAGNVDLGGAGGITTYQGNVTIGTNAQGYLSVRSNITSTTGNIIATQGNIKVDGPNGNLIGNVITDHIVSDSSQSLQLKGQANGIQVDKTISSTESRIFDADTSGYSVASADLGAFSTNTSVPSFLTGLFITAGGNTGTSYDLAGGAGFYVQKESVNNTYTSVFGSSS